MIYYSNDLCFSKHKTTDRVNNEAIKNTHPRLKGNAYEEIDIQNNLIL